MRNAIFLLGTLIILGSLAFYGVFTPRHVSLDNAASLSAVTNPIPQKEIKLVFVGDVMLSRGIGKIMKDRNDYGFPFASTTDLIRSADIAFANLESPISVRGIRSGSIYSFRADPKAVAGLTHAGFDIVSFANNHVWDYGKTAFEDTLSHLESAGIKVVVGGEDYDLAHEAKIIQVRNTTFAFLAYTNLLPKSLGSLNSTPSVARYDDDHVLIADVLRAKEKADIVIVSFHWGDEYQTSHNDEQERVAKLVIDSGASLVVGHHPHVIQEVEQYKDGYIFYSLGNFVFDQNFSVGTKKGLLMEAMVEGCTVTKVVKREVVFTDDYKPYFVERGQ